MRITSMDIDSKEFKKSFRGYDIDDVNDFLNEVADNYEELYKENSLYKEKVNNYEEKVENYRRIEETIQNTLVLAQGAAEQAKQAAEKEANIIIKNANESAKKILDKANNDVLKINDEYERIKQEFEKFKTVFRNFMNSQMDMFERLDKEFGTDYTIDRTGKDNVNVLSFHEEVSEQQFPESKTIDNSNPLILEELNENTAKVQDSLNDFIARNNIDISKIQNNTLSEVDMLISK